MKKYDIVYVELDPTKGSEQHGTRPCIILQNNLANRFGSTTVIATLTTTLKKYPHTLIVEASKENGLNKRVVSTFFSFGPSTKRAF